MSEIWTKAVPKWFQNLSNIHPGGALEATWEPPLKQGASKTSLLTILAPTTFEGAANHHLFDDFLEHRFGMPFGTQFYYFGSLLGSLLETISVTFLAFWHRFLDPPKTAKKEGILCSVLAQCCTLPPLLGLLPPS